MNVLFAGGGTGGHLYPAIALADALGSRATVAFAGTADRLEATIVPAAGYPLHAVESRPLSRKVSFDLARTSWSNLRGTQQSIALIARLRPDIVIATGGYVCFPVVAGARALRAAGRFRGAIALLEPNATPGLTNRLLAPLVDEVWGAFATVDERFRGKYVHTGVPVRASLLALPSREEAMRRLALDRGYRTLLAMGGSQGARTINDALVAVVAAGRFPEGWQLALISGPNDFERTRAALAACGARARVFPYLDDLADAYASADLVLARSGASTLGELSALGLPSILVPYPFAAENHQAANAELVRAAGAAIVVEDARLAQELPGVLAEATGEERLAALRDAAAKARGADAVATILARVAALAARKSS